MKVEMLYTLPVGKGAFFNIVPVTADDQPARILIGTPSVVIGPGSTIANVSIESDGRLKVVPTGTTGSADFTVICYNDGVGVINGVLSLTVEAAPPVDTELPLAVKLILTFSAEFVIS